jgi:AraC family transcriptional regulator
MDGLYATEARHAGGLCGASTVIFNPSGTTHRDHFHSSTGEFLAISLSKEVAELIESSVPFPIVLRNREMVRTLREACTELRNADTASAFVLEGLGMELSAAAPGESYFPDRKPPKWLIRSRDLIRDCHANDLTIAAVAAVAEIHPVYLARAFRQYFHYSPGKYLRACRIDKARQLLAGSDLTLAEISQETGFYDQSQLTRAFKTATGRTPGEFRRAFS